MPKFNPGDTVEVLDDGTTGIWAGEIGVVKTVTGRRGQNIFVALPPNTWLPFSPNQLRHAQQRLETDDN